MAYVEVKAKTVELAVEAAMAELGVTSRDRVEVEILQEPERGFLGMGGKDAIVKVRERSGANKRKRSRKRNRGNGEQQNRSEPRPTPSEKRDAGRSRGESNRGRREQGKKQMTADTKDDRDAVDTADQEPLVKGFLEGLVEAFGLEGSVAIRRDEDVIVASVEGEQTQALVGPRGSVMEAVHELTKTRLQREVQEPARVRLDIAGYAERRRQALTIYAGELIRQVLEEGGELMLEPMSAADRKVVHDAVAEHAGVRSYSEGESPRRYVVIAATEGADDSGEEE